VLSVVVRSANGSIRRRGAERPRIRSKSLNFDGKTIPNRSKKPHPNRVQKGCSNRAQKPSKKRKKAGQELAKSWSGAGQKLARNWPKAGQKLARNEPKSAQKVFKTGSLQKRGCQKRHFHKHFPISGRDFDCPKYPPP